LYEWGADVKPTSKSFDSALRRHWKKVSSEWKKARGKSSQKSVHDLRVGVRRMIMLLEFFAAFDSVDSNRVEKLRKRFKKILRLIGPLRDVQVAHSGFNSLKSPNSFGGFGKSLKREEAAELNRVRRKLKPERKSKLRDGIDALIKDSANIPSHALGRTPPLIALVVVRRRLRRLETARRSFRPASSASLHKMRIALKKLRYALETTKELFGQTPAGGVKSIETHQTRMGNLRDLQLLQARLQHWANGSRPVEAHSIQAVLLEIEERSSKLMGDVKTTHRQLARPLEVLGTKLAY